MVLTLRNVQWFSQHLFMTWIRRYTQKKLISKISADSNFTFSSYAWLCVFHCSHRLLCWIKSRVRDLSVEISLKLLSFHTEMVLAKFLWGSVLLKGELRKYEKISNFENFESALYSTSGSMPLILTFKCLKLRWRTFIQFCFCFDINYWNKMDKWVIHHCG